MISLNQKIAIISGASGGLGQTVSQMFHQAGAKLVLLGSRPSSVQPLADDLGGDAVLPLGADLTNPAEAERVVAAAIERFGRVDILLNLAGGFTGGDSVAGSDPATLQKMLDMNLWTAYNLCRAAMPSMLEQQWGRIVNVGARDALAGRANYSAYGISKAGVLRLTESLAAEGKKRNVTVNAVLPGAIDTAANRQAMPNADFSKWVRPETIGHTLLFLCRSNTAITGAAIPMYEQFE
jgi:NAD(P)-dependent dehydrogenase (short-subunit alcohol dehydrogenase family)